VIKWRDTKKLSVEENWQGGDGDGKRDLSYEQKGCYNLLRRLRRKPPPKIKPDPAHRTNSVHCCEANLPSGHERIVALMLPGENCPP
jgi:hypothetical protein